MNKLVVFLLLAIGLLGSAQAQPAGPVPRFVLLPLDNRPCNLLFVRQLTRLAEAEVVTPPGYWLGSFLNPGFCQRFPQWLQQTVRAGDNLVISSDMLCYGGLVASRNGGVPQAEALQRLQILRELRKREAHLEVLAIVPRLSLRTSEGEAPYERKLAIWAGQYDKSPQPADYPVDVPPVWVEEYLRVRRRNLDILLEVIGLVQEGSVDRLVIGQDDSSNHGLHYYDQDQLRQRIQSLHLEKQVTLLSGADELTMDMFSGRLADLYDCHPTLGVEYSRPGSEKLIPPLESHPLETMIRQHIELSGARLAEPGSSPAAPRGPGQPEDVRIFVEVPIEHPFRLPDEGQRPDSVAFVERVREWIVRGRLAAVADLALVNRMNPYLAEAVLQRIPLTSLEGFAGWNTPANAFGTVVAHVMVRRMADLRARHWPIARVKESARAHLAFLLARLIDDYGYQAVLREEYYAEARGLPANPEPLLSPYLSLGREVRVALIDWARQLYTQRFQGKVVQLPGGRGPARLGECKLEVILPWPRLFEVEVRLDLELLPVDH